MRAEKELLLNEIQDKIVASQGFIITQYKSFSPQMSWELTKLLKENKSNFEVVKKSVFVKAAKKANIEIDQQALAGQIGILFVDNDIVETTKTFCKFIDGNGELLKVISAYVAGRTYNEKDVIEMSKLPSLDVMRAQFLGLLEAPMAELLSVMQSLLTCIIYCFINKCQKNEVKP
jgi:large subunit ribosomal protein L10